MRFVFRAILALIYFTVIVGAVILAIITWPVVIWIPVLLAAAIVAWICWVIAGDHVGINPPTT